jgi:hypothetical protein
VARLARLMKHITVDELMELAEDIACVKKREDR